MWVGLTKLIDIYTAINGLLGERYHDIKIYGKEVKEGFDKPAFFVSLDTVNNENQSVNFRYKKYDVLIVYFQDKKDEIDNFEKIDELIDLFGNTIKVKDRYIRVIEYDHEYIGEDDDILQFTFTIEYFDDVEKEEKHQTMSELVINEEMR